MEASTAESVEESVEMTSLDMKSVEADITAGARAFERLERHAAGDWLHWTIAIRGLRALRNLAFAQAGTSDLKSHAYRREIGRLLELKKHAAYTRIDKQTRSTCYKLMDHLEEITKWHGSLSSVDQLRWKHPDAIAKHCPKHFLGMGHNRPPKKKRNEKKPNHEAERLRALCIRVIRRLAKHEPDAIDLLDSVDPDDPDDDLVEI